MEAQEEAAQLIEPFHSQGASESDVIVVRTSQSGDTIILEEPNSDTADKVATDERTSKAIAFKNRAVKCMAAKDTNAFKSLLEDLGRWQPCAASLRKSGAPLIFHDVKSWEDAKVSDEACELRTKFTKIMKSGRKNSSADLTSPFNSVSFLQFRQTVNSMEAFVQGG